MSETANNYDFPKQEKVLTAAGGGRVDFRLVARWAAAQTGGLRFDRELRLGLTRLEMRRS